jgi:undecaprenyl diphosphate synthase
MMSVFLGNPTALTLQIYFLLKGFAIFFLKILGVLMTNKFKRLPRHIAVIPDGNRRWAKSRGLKKSEGYGNGLAPGIKLYEQCLELGIPEMTFYGFTNDNMKRPAEETLAFREACVAAVESMREKDAAILVVGNSESQVFPPELIRYRTRQPSGKNLMKVNFLVNYDWHWDIHTAVSHAPSGNRKDLLQSVASAEIPRIDLVIRWGGRRRLSGMLPLQSVYSDFFVIDKYWPDLTPDHLESALKWYDEQDVTLGG